MLRRILAIAALAAAYGGISTPRANADGRNTIRDAEFAPIYADFGSSDLAERWDGAPLPEFWRVRLKKGDRLIVDFGDPIANGSTAVLCLLDPSVTDETLGEYNLTGPPCTKEQWPGSNNQGELDYTANTSGDWTLMIYFNWCCGDPAVYEIYKILVLEPPKPKPKPVTATGGYPWTDAKCAYGNKPPTCDFSWGYRIGGSWQIANPRTGNRFFYRNCTDYVAWYVLYREKKKKFPFRGNAIEWKGEARRGSGWVVTSKPHVGDIAWWGSSLSKYGHVAIVLAKAAHGKIKFGDYNWGNIHGEWGRYHTAVTKPGDRIYPRAFLHYTGK